MTVDETAGFSTLQRAENSSIHVRFANARISAPVSVLFSEPKIPQWIEKRIHVEPDAVSVLFSEPKIPQFPFPHHPPNPPPMFQYSSASRKFLNREEVAAAVKAQNVFQYSSASRKFLNLARFGRV